MGAGNNIEIPSFSIDIEIQKDISIDIEISIYDPNTSYGATPWKPHHDIVHEGVVQQHI